MRWTYHHLCYDTAAFRLPSRHSSLAMLVFATLLASLSSTVRSRAALELENLALRHQIGVLQRSARKPPKLTPVDRLLWAWLSLVRVLRANGSFGRKCGLTRLHAERDEVVIAHW